MMHIIKKLSKHCILDCVYQEKPLIEDYKQLLGTRELSKVLVAVFDEDFKSVSFMKPNKNYNGFE